MSEETEDLVTQIQQGYPEDFQFTAEDVINIVEAAKAGTLTYAEIRALNPPFDAGIDEGFEAMEKSGFSAELVFTLVDELAEGKTTLNQEAIDYLNRVIGKEVTTDFVGNIALQFAKEVEKDDV